MMHMPPVSGWAQPAISLNLELINGWLFTIDTKRIKNAKVRERVLQYQRECYRVLYHHFSGESDRLARFEHDRDSLSVRLVAECRQIYGNKAAGELWKERGLPIVPAMNDLLAQGDLFSQLPAKSAA